MNVRVASRVAKRLQKRLKDLRKVKNFKEILQMLEIDEEVLSRPPERQILTDMLQNYKISAVKYSIGEPMLFNFMNLSATFCSSL